MTSFSDRAGLGRNLNLIQIGSCDEGLRKAIWNAFYGVLPKNQEMSSRNGVTSWIAQYFYYNLLNEPIDEIDAYESDRRNVLKEYLLSCPWNKVYDFVEVAYRCFESLGYQESFVKYVNSALQREASGYRLLDGMAVEVTSEIELQAISNAMEETPEKGPQEHIRRAAELLFDRENPDYRNSIKESISAVEGMVRGIVSDQSATLGSALKKIEEKHAIHPALKDAFIKIYGYTSDVQGVRHGMLDESKVGFSEAKYMLLACSAFINYLVEVRA